MSRRSYAGAAAALNGSASMGVGDTSFAVTGITGNWPDGSAGPFAISVNRGFADEEKMLCTTRSGTTFTVTRAYDGTSAVTHGTNFTVELIITAVDADEANAHVNASTGVHGLAGAVVGTSDAQTLTNKTLTSPTINGAVLSGTLSGSPAFSGTPQFNANLKGSGGLTLTLPTTTDTLVGRATTDTLSNKTLTTPVIQDGNANTVISIVQGGVLLSTAATATQPALAVATNAPAQFALQVNAATGQTVDTAIFGVSSGTTLAVDKNGHLCGRGTAPTASAGANAGTSPPAPVVTAGSNDQSGNVTCGTGTTPAATANAIVNVIFNRVYAAIPAGIVVTPRNSATAALGPPYVSAKSVSQFTIAVPGAPTVVAASQANTVYSFDYVITGA